ncbi:MAG: glutamate synthase large subunit [Coprobacillaceae bacterium]
MQREEIKNNKYPLYHSSFEHDNCGIGAVVNVSGKKTHYTVDQALQIVERLEHRAGKDARNETGDGVGILTQIPDAYFQEVISDFELPILGEYGVGMFFLPKHEKGLTKVMDSIEDVLKKNKLSLLGWRKVITTPTILGQKALDAMPSIYQCFIKKPNTVNSGLDFERILYVARKKVEALKIQDTYICSLSSKTIVYKGMFLVNQLRLFFNDLQNPQYKSAIALVHSRFSTNTMPSWQRAHPNRFIVHNGEINTIKGNSSNMLCREETMECENIPLEEVYPVVNTEGSDSARLDNTLEFLVMSGIELPRAVMMCIPEPYENNKEMSQSKKDFYEYNATLMEPWDGPASILFSDGDCMGAMLDRNGLRPSRYYITKDGYLILSSEVGVVDIPAEEIVLKERLHPGKMLLIDTKAGRIIEDDELKEMYAKKQPYGQWLEKNLTSLKDMRIPNRAIERVKGEELILLQKAHGYSYEDVYTYIKTLAMNASEEVVAMGTDSPLAVLSKQKQPLFNYFKQLFAQVTNPPIDAIREEIITSTSLYIGMDGNILKDVETNCRLLKVENPIISNTDLLKIKHIQKDGFKVAVLPMIYSMDISLEKAMESLYQLADKKYQEGNTIFILSDRGVNEENMAIPSLLATAAMNQYLVKTKKRSKIALIIESAEPREVHHYATLLGYGASAVNGYLAQDTILSLVEQGIIEKDPYAAIDDYQHGILHGIIKIASKMGISTLQSYRGSQNFEAIGISSDMIDKYFPNTISRIEGKNILDIEEEYRYHHQLAFDVNKKDLDISLNSYGLHKERSGMEEHLYNPKTIHMLQKATREGDYNVFKEYSKLIEEESNGNIRSLLTFNKKRPSISIEEVESVESIVKRFKTGAMSYGSISKEAHETMAIAMNRLHAKSNSGEGGEDPSRFVKDDNGDNRCSAIKQIASGRFGVTSEYLCSAREIQIKMAQGAKPGEGGQLPAAKVYPWVAKTRHSTTGVGLISPPPHHDIYSIEDLAQLIYDAKNANQKARISVKLVSEAGVGTIAAGVAKAGAEVILISGYDGGTGAAPRNSVYNAGLPWELGLAEAHQTLVMNELRRRVVLEVDGKLMTGRDLAIATLLGAEEYGFATTPLVTMGCVMMRVCNLDTCPVGIATQNPILRKRFNGKPEYVVNFMRFIAQELREYMAELGFKTIEEMVGHTELLSAKENIPIDVSKIVTDISLPIHHHKKDIYDFELDTVKDTTILIEKCKGHEKQPIQVDVTNLDRSFGTLFGSTLTNKYGTSMHDDQFQIHCKGAGGQSFGAFIPKGMTIHLEGDSNDYLGKGLSGGKIIVTPPKGAKYQPEKNIIIGNVALYGATSGEAYIYGIAGERFGVRNSGVTAVVEGVGDHGLEYMTGGIVAVLGSVGKNFAAGMSGGIAYVYDPNNSLYNKINKEMVTYNNITMQSDEEQLKTLLNTYYQHTKSKTAKYILDNYGQEVQKFKKIIPYDYQKMITMIETYKKQGLSSEEAELQAFEIIKEGV